MRWLEFPQPRSRLAVRFVRRSQDSIRLRNQLFCKGLILVTRARKRRCSNITIARIWAKPSPVQNTINCQQRLTLRRIEWFSVTGVVSCHRKDRSQRSDLAISRSNSCYPFWHLTSQSFWSTLQDAALTRKTEKSEVKKDSKSSENEDGAEKQPAPVEGTELAAVEPLVEVNTRPVKDRRPPAQLEDFLR